MAATDETNPGAGDNPGIPGGVVCRVGERQDGVQLLCHGNSIGDVISFRAEHCDDV